MSKALIGEFLQAIAAGSVRIVDMTQPMHEGTPVLCLPEPFANDPGFSKHLLSRFDDAGPAWYWNWMKLGEHTGTHFDAPCHWITGRDLATMDQVPVEDLIGPAVVLDLCAKVVEDSDYLLSVEDITDWEQQHGRIPDRAWVIMQTGWSRFGNDSAQFLNVGEDQRPHWPGFSSETATFLTTERSVLGVGTEAVGTDGASAAGHEPPFPNHRIMHGAGKYGLASLTNVDQLPPVGSILIAAPLKIVDGSGSPMRALALVPA